MSDNENRIVITNDLLESAQVSQSVKAMQEAASFTTVRSVGAPAPKGAGWKAVAILAGAGFLGGAITFGVHKITTPILENFSVKTSNIFFTFAMAFIIGLTVALIDAGTTKIAQKVLFAALIAVPTSIVSGVAIGFAVNAYFSKAATDLYYDYLLAISNGSDEASAMQAYNNAMHLPRGIAWLMVGIACGLTVGIASKSLKRTGLTVAGGAVGGFIGGFLFEFFPEAVAQFVGMTVTGLLIGLSMAILEQAARTQWIEIVEGGMAGKQFILYKDVITLGSSPTSDITLIKDPSILAAHARIYASSGRSYIESLDPNRPVSVNGVVGLRTSISDLDYITLGSTQIQFRERSGAQKSVTGSVGRLS